MAEQDVSAIGGRTRWAFYVVAFIFPIGGVLLSAILSGRPEPGARLIARNALVAALSASVLACFCLLIDMLVFMRF